MSLNNQVRDYWEKEACGTSPQLVGDVAKYTREWYEQIEQHRYKVEPFIHSIAQYTRYHGKKVLEIGVGAGTDHLQWARAGAECYGVDLTDEAIDVTCRRLAMYGITPNLQRVDAEKLPFEDETFDLVYCWGVIHHSENPKAIVAEIKRVLKPGGQFVGMIYHRYSLTVFKLWIRHGLLRGKPWRSFSDIVWHHVESIGTKAYTVRELRRLFADYRHFTTQPIITSSDLINHGPVWLNRFLPNFLGWFIALGATK